ncbi:phosphatase PAP2 family protein [Veronia pacifica]|uniref:undecaprenyl-diphosphate phosphatase n=1 Tax=Veronia pacifica TaxID=1080227 RepID=A0A1C3EE19_9GAMM|nr:phosphatase PAP2 family protein [Veronia pacifica]ODA31475.1 phosphoesterase [Veronia pacifica]
MKNYVVASALAASMVITPMAHAKSDSLTRTGDITQIAVPVGAGIISLMKDDTEGFFQLAEGALYTAAATHTLKAVVDAPRPDGSSNNSFPSGHTSAAAQGAAYLQFRYGWEYGVPAYALTALVGYSRVQAKRHYWRDVAAGAAIATGIQYAVTELGYSATGTYVMPYFNGDAVGVTANVKF